MIGRLLEAVGIPPWAIAVAVALSVLIGTNIWSYNRGIDSERADQEAAQREALSALYADLEEKEAQGRKVVSELQKTEAENRRLRDKLNGQVDDVTDGRVCFADWDAVRLWNQALSGSSDVPAASGGAPEGAAGAAATDAEILRNQIENAARWKSCRDQVNAIRKLNREWFGEKQ